MGDMARLPFDPGRARGAEAKESGASVPERGEGGAAEVSATGGDSVDRPMSVSQVVTLINDALAAKMPAKLRVVGEVSNLSVRNHWFFSLKDEQAVLKCVAWASRAKSFGFAPTDGMSVVATGSVQFYGPQGQCQLYVERLEPVGLGALEAKFRAMCDELRRLGYFEAERKRAIPSFPRKVAVVTSEKGAALQDVLDTMRRRCPAVGVVVVDVRVQGAEAAGEIAGALKMLARRHRALGIDAVLLTRGGGSIEDLWAFNERVVADALFGFPIPTVAAIGHETDTTIAELVADLRAATPTQAAMALTPDRRELLEQTAQSGERLRRAAKHRVEVERHRVEGLRHRLGTPAALVERAVAAMGAGGMRLAHAVSERWHRASAMLERLLRRLEAGRPERLAREREKTIAVAAIRLRTVMERHRTGMVMRVEGLEQVLRGIDPRGVLQRGFTITRRGRDGKVLRSAKEAAKGERIATVFADGTVQSEVVDGGGTEAKGGRRGRPGGEGGLPQLDLFNPDR